MNKYCLLVFLLFTSVSIGQNAWTKKKGEAYTQISFTTINNYDEMFGEPDYQPERKITDNTLQLYGEYGITDKTTLIVNIPVKFIKTAGLISGDTPITLAESKTSLGNIEVGIKHRLYNKKWVVSGQINVETNTSSFYKTSGIQTGYNAWSFKPTINIGRSFKGFYAQAFTGLDIKTSSYSSNFKIGGEIGTKPIKNILLIGFIDVVKSFNNGDVILPTNNILTGLYVNNQEYSAIGLKAIGQINDNTGATIGVGGALSGNNVAKQTALSLGLYHKF